TYFVKLKQKLKFVFEILIKSARFDIKADFFEGQNINSIQNVSNSRDAIAKSRACDPACKVTLRRCGSAAPCIAGRYRARRGHRRQGRHRRCTGLPASQERTEECCLR